MFHGLYHFLNQQILVRLHDAQRFRVTLNITADGHAYGNAFLRPLQEIRGTVVQLLQHGFKIVAHKPRIGALVFGHVYAILVQLLEDDVLGLVKSARINVFRLVGEDFLMTMYMLRRFKVTVASPAPIFLGVQVEIPDVRQMVLEHVQIHS